METEPALDLAIVRRGEAAPGAVGVAGPGGRLPGASGGLPLRAVAVHSVTAASRVLAFDGDFCECYFRYEGWVPVVSRRVPLCPGLAPLAGELAALEPGRVAWEANAIGVIIGRLHPEGDGRTELSPDRVQRTVESYLGSAPPATGLHGPAPHRQRACTGQPPTGMGRHEPAPAGMGRHGPAPAGMGRHGELPTGMGRHGELTGD